MSNKFTFINEYTNLDGNLVQKSTLEISEDSLSEILDSFSRFLKGSGYHFDGELQIVTPYEFSEDSDE